MAMLRLVIVLFIGLFCRIDAASAQDGRDYVRVIGRPETLAYAADVAEALVRNAQRKYPQLEQSSDEGAIRTFCTTVRDTPDLMLLPQAIEDARPVVCPSLEPLLNLPIGRQVFVVYSAPDAPEFRLTREILFRAMARELPRRDSEGALASFERNPNLRWSEIDPSLPDVPIRLLLPPRRSVQWLAIEDLVMRPGCASIPAIAELALIDQQMASQRCLARRTDFSLNYADPSAASGSQARIPKGTELSLNELRFVPEGMALVAVEGTIPDRAAIESGHYRMARQVVAVVKRNRLDAIPSLRDYLQEMTSPAAAGPGGYLQRSGLDPLSETVLRQSATQARFAMPEAVRRLQAKTVGDAAKPDAGLAR